MKRPCLHLLVGLPCSGKSAYARKAQTEYPSVILNADSWELALFGPIYPSEQHEIVHDQLEKLLWGLGKQILKQGSSVMLDYGFWSRQERESYRQAAAEIGADFLIHYLDTPMDLIAKRVKLRSAQEGEFNLKIEDILSWSELFEAPLPGDPDTIFVKPEDA